MAKGLFRRVAALAASAFLGSMVSGSASGDNNHASTPARPVAKRVSRAEADRAEEYWTPERMRSATPMSMPAPDGPIQDDTSSGSPDDIVVSHPASPDSAD